MNKTARAWINGLFEVVIFSGSLPATRLAVVELDPFFLTVARAAIAGLLGCGLLMVFRQQRPERSDLVSLCIVALGVVVGFPLLSALALTRITSAHAIIFIGLVPLATALFGVLRGGERPRAAFWLCSGVGGACVAGFAMTHGLSASPVGDLPMLAAILVCGLGYAEGTTLSRRLGSRQVISWALVLSLSIMLLLAILILPHSFDGRADSTWMSLAHVSLFSMLIGFIFWYRGLAQGGIAAVGQPQLLPPLFGLGLAATLLHEQVSAGMVAVTLLVLLCVVGAKRVAT